MAKKPLFEGPKAFAKSVNAKSIVLPSQPAREVSMIAKTNVMATWERWKAEQAAKAPKPLKKKRVGPPAEATSVEVRPLRRAK